MKRLQTYERFVARLEGEKCGLLDTARYHDDLILFGCLAHHRGTLLEPGWLEVEDDGWVTPSKEMAKGKENAVDVYLIFVLTSMLLGLD